MQTFLLYETTTVGAGVGKPNLPMNASYQATVRGTGAVAAKVVIEASNDGEEYLPLGTISLTGTGKASDGFPTSSNWYKVRARIEELTGTGAKVTVAVGA